MTDTMIEKFWALVDRRGEDECWPWKGRFQGNGHGFMYGYFGRRSRAHRVAWEIANSMRVPSGLVVRHKCDNPGCVNPSHLEIGTQKQNVADRYERGRDRHIIGSSHGNAKFTEADVISIRKRVMAGEKQNAIAAEYGVSSYAVRYVLHLGWKHIEKEEA